MSLPNNISIELFIQRKFTTEKVSFQLGNRTFHVGQGNRQEDGLRTSPLWRGRYSTQEFRLSLWRQIQRYLPHYQDGTLDQVRQRRTFNSYDFLHVLRLAKAYNKYGSLRLIHTGDIEHAEMIARCAVWLAQQIR